MVFLPKVVRFLFRRCSFQPTQNPSFATRDDVRWIHKVGDGVKLAYINTRNAKVTQLSARRSWGRWYAWYKVSYTSTVGKRERREEKWMTSKLFVPR